MGISASIGKFDGRMIGLDGRVRFYPKWLFEKLKRMDDSHKKHDPTFRFLKRDKISGLWQILPIIKSFKKIFELQHFNERRQLRAFDLAYYSGLSKDSGRKSTWDLIESGTTVNEHQMREDASEIDHTPAPGRPPINDEEVDALVKSVVRKRSIV